MMRKMILILAAMLLLIACAQAEEVVIDLAAAGETAVIAQPGVYRLTGKSEQIQLLITAEKKAEIVLILDGASADNAAGAVLVSQHAVDVTLRLAEGTQNRLTSGKTVDITGEQVPEENAGAAVQIKGDLTIEGDGALFVGGYLKNGIQASGKVKLKQGEVTIEAIHNGLRGAEGVKVKGGVLTVTAGGDGISASDEGKGEVEFSGGIVAIRAWGDAVQAQTALSVTGGVISLTTGLGADAVPYTAEDQFGMHGRNGFGRWPGQNMQQPAYFQPGQEPGQDRRGEFRPGQTAEQPADENAKVSRKGLKSAGTVTIGGGEVTIDAEDDGIHAANVTMNGGSVSLRSGDDGVHADAALIIAGGELTVARSAEGLEGETILISGGTIDVTAFDDGINATDGSGMDAGFGGFGQNAQSTVMLRITGGTLHVSAEGDGLDSNGSLVIEGGCVIVDGPSSPGNGALDSGSGCKIMGGTVLALSAGSMEEGFEQTSAQPYLMCRVQIEAGAEVVICGSDGAELLRHTSPRSAGILIFSCPGLQVGDRLTVTADGKQTETTVAASYDMGMNWGRW